MRIVIIGQSTFASGVYKEIRKTKAHEVVGVFTVPDKGRIEDPLGKKIYFYNVTKFV